MKKRYLLLMSVLVLGLAFGGCGKKKDTENSDAVIEATKEPEISTKPKDEDVVKMQQTTGIDKSRITKFMGTKTTTSAELVVTNETGIEIAEFYVRPSGTEDWGEDLIQSKFTLKDKEMALYYYDKDEKVEDGDSIDRYDLRVSYTDPDESDCFFRELPIKLMEEVKLSMADGVPYVTYVNTQSKQNVSTLSEARERMGLNDSDDDYDQDTSDTEDTTDTDDGSDDSSSTEPTPTPDPDTGDNGGDTSGGDGGSTPPGMENQGSSMSDIANNNIGGDFGSLQGEIGGPNGSDYSIDEATGGQIGYHYYDGFTVSTAVDDAGNEIITGVW